MQAPERIEIVVEGKKYVLNRKDISALDERDFRREIGHPIWVAFADQRLLGLDAIAALVWIKRRKSEPHLTFEQLAAEVNYDNVKIEDETTSSDAPAGDESVGEA